MSFFQPRSSSSSGVRVTTTSGSSSVPASAAWREICDQLLDRLARQLAPQAGGQRAPLVLVEVRPSGGPVEVLQGAATRLRAYEFDAVVVAQHAYVVADDAEWSAKLHGEVARARDPLAEPLQDACAQRMGQGFRDPGLRGFPRRSGPAITGWG